MLVTFCLKIQNENKEENGEAPPAPEKKLAAAYMMPYEEVMAVDKLADEINNEVSELAFGLEPDYDWKLADLLL